MRKVFDCSDNKHVLHNIAAPVPRSVVARDLDVPESPTEDTKKKKKKSKSPPRPPPLDLNEPVLNSTEAIKQVMQQIENKKPKKVTSLSKVEQPERRTIDERVTRQMNFPFDKKIYKELISLKLSETKMEQYHATHYPPYFKDKVPKLEEFYVPKEGFEYNIPTMNNLPPINSTKQYDGLRIHKVMQTWKDSRPD